MINYKTNSFMDKNSIRAGTHMLIGHSRWGYVSNAFDNVTGLMGVGESIDCVIHQRTAGAKVAWVQLLAAAK